MMIKIFAMWFIIIKILIPCDFLNAEESSNQEILASPFDPHTAFWNIDWPGRVSKHDLVYLSPLCDPMQGIPLGNGDVGALFWCEDSKIIIAVNKCNLWDDASTGRFHNWKREEEEFSTTLRHACRIIIDFKVPVFDIMYLSDFKGRLSLADASMNLFSSTPFGAITVRAFVNHKDGLLYCKVKSDLTGNPPVELTVERFGSRTFSHWYSLINRDAKLGLSGTEASIDENGAYITHKLTSGQFGVGCKIIEEKGLKISYNKIHSNASGITLSGASQKEFSFIVSVTSPLPENPIHQLKNFLSSVQEKEIPEVFEEHKNSWKSFWMRSLMEFGDDYFDNLWHLTMYYANASQRGNYPGRFINGLWTWNRDVQNWNFYFHWNQQEIYWPLNAAGHHDLIDSYLNYRFNSLPHAQEDAKELFNTEGAFVSDVAERRGYNSLSELDNHTPVAEIALDFWRQYCYTGDKEFLRIRALPYMIEASKFFESLFEKGMDGKYHARNGTGYEGWIKLKDGLTELVYAKALFSTAIDALTEAGVKEPRSEKWNEILNNLTPLPIIKAEDRLIGKEKNALKLKQGFFKSDTAASDEIIAAGFGIKEGKMLTGRVPSDQVPETGMAVYDGIFPTVECSVVFPSGLIGISQKNSRLFNAVINTLKLYSPDCMGWDPLPIAFARLGFAKEFSAILRNWAERWQFYCNGWGHYGPLDVMKSDANLRFQTAQVRDATLSSREQEKQKIPFPAWQFRHMGMESMSVLACAMNEALLQSYDGVIRIAPAVSESQNVRFTLHAVGGFIISAEIKDGSPMWICIVSRLGNNCKIHSPWNKSHLFKNDRKVRSFEEKILEFPTQRNEIFMLVSNENMLTTWKTTPVQYQQNENYKTDVTGKATLGLQRMF